MSDNVSAQKAICDSLVAYLQAQLGTAVKTYLSEFPTGQKLEMPAISVTIVREQFSPDSGIEASESDPDPVTGLSTVLSYVGDLTLTLQIDIFAANKYTRSVLQQAVISSLNPTATESTGLKITMSAYYNQVASFVLSGGGAHDDGIAAQTNEWRSRLEVTADCDVIATSIQALMQDIVLQGQIQEVNGSGQSEFVAEIN